MKNDNQDTKENTTHGFFDPEDDDGTNNNNDPHRPEDSDEDKPSRLIGILAGIGFTLFFVVLPFQLIRYIHVIGQENIALAEVVSQMSKNIQTEDKNMQVLNDKLNQLRDYLNSQPAVQFCIGKACDQLDPSANNIIPNDQESPTVQSN